MKKHGGTLRQTIDRAAEICRQRGERLTPLRRKVLELILRQQTPLKAYDIMKRINDGLCKPPTVLPDAGLSPRPRTGAPHQQPQRLDRLPSSDAVARLPLHDMRPLRPSGRMLQCRFGADDSPGDGQEPFQPPAGGTGNLRPLPALPKAAVMTALIAAEGITVTRRRREIPAGSLADRRRERFRHPHRPERRRQNHPPALPNGLFSADTGAGMAAPRTAHRLCPAIIQLQPRCPH